MTEALDAMVRAMVAEIMAQECRLELQADGVTLDSGYDGASFDLEKVARAGLEACALDLAMIGFDQSAEGFNAEYGALHGKDRKAVTRALVLAEILKEPTARPASAR